MSTFKTKLSQLRTLLAYLKELCFGPYFDLDLRPEDEQKKFRFQAYIMAGTYGAIVFSCTELVFMLLLGRTSAIFPVAALLVCWTLWRMQLPGYVAMTVRCECEDDQVIGFKLKPFKATRQLISLYVYLLLLTMGYFLLFTDYRPPGDQTWKETIAEINPFVFQMALLLIMGFVLIRCTQWLGRSFRAILRGSPPW